MHVHETPQTCIHSIEQGGEDCQCCFACYDPLRFNVTTTSNIYASQGTDVCNMRLIGIAA